MSTRSLLAAWGTYEVRVGGLRQLLLSILSGGGIFVAVSTDPKSNRQGKDYLPGDNVPSNTWLMSMIAGGCFKESKRGIEQLDN